MALSAVADSAHRLHDAQLVAALLELVGGVLERFNQS
jgi:hypothetical protein